MKILLDEAIVGSDIGVSPEHFCLEPRFSRTCILRGGRRSSLHHERLNRAGRRRHGDERPRGFGRICSSRRSPVSPVPTGVDPVQVYSPEGAEQRFRDWRVE